MSNQKKELYEVNGGLYVTDVGGGNAVKLVGPTWNDNQDTGSGVYSADEIDDDLPSQYQFGTHFDPQPFWGITGASAVTANRAYGVKFRVARNFTATSIKASIESGSAGNIDANIYSSPDLTTWTRLGGVSTPVSTAGTGLVTVTLATPVAMVVGTDYWMFIAIDNATATVLRHQIAGATAVAALDNMYLSKTSSYPLPATLTSLTTNQNMIWGRIVGS
jgi:hypothetical protein